MSQHDGAEKKWTKDCETCPYRGHETITNKRTCTEEVQPSCTWGVTIKILGKGSRVRACEYRHQQPEPGSAFLRDRHLSPTIQRRDRRIMAKEIQGSLL